MQCVRLKKTVPIRDLLQPPQVVTRDLAGRITRWVYEYKSVTATYDVEWAAESGAELVDIAQTVTDNP